MDLILNWIFMSAIHHLKEEIILFCIFLILVVFVTHVGNKHRFSNYYKVSSFLDKLSTKLLLINLIALVDVTIWAVIEGLNFFNR
ncbi:hypothetical protein A3P64_07795 [Lactobacillus johnsonii]|uniref:Uncharacterized protein n=1 Tax=Lactobacillus johnsonii TaxID=33959 RepID=A0AAX0PTE7_LACJH|nr:hypothetical protein A3P60_04050 [Lactobacillus johnsonii]PAB52171.1 hypothetical protein A3P64_07795 [Lactobacillus johnsonii]